jgi:raffinose/stachyose/melibiose transport system substrate-binding protein
MRTVRRALSLVAVLALVAGCGASPGGSGGDNQEKADQAKKSSKKIDVSKAGDVTLTVWDQEVRGGQAKQIKQLNAAFQQKYPNVKIKRVAKSFDDLNTTLKLAVSGSKAPDVVQANQGRQVMGQLVKGGLLKPLDAYADAYGWADRYSKVLVDLNRFSDDGKEFGSGSLYGLSQMGEIVGVYYNKDKVSSPPKTFSEFEAALQKAKDDGEVPISFGNLDPFAGTHEF